MKEEEKRLREASASISPYTAPPHPAEEVQLIQCSPVMLACPVKEEREIILPFPSCNVMFSKEELEKENVTVVEEEEKSEISGNDLSVMFVKCTLLNRRGVCESGRSTKIRLEES